MKKILCEKIVRIIKGRKFLEENLKVKIVNRGKEVTITGRAPDEYIAEKVIEAVNFGFAMEHAILIKKDDLTYAVLNIKDYTKRQDLERIRGRIIGSEGRTKNTLIHLSDCFIEVNGNSVAVIGHPENVEKAQEAIVSLIKGTKQSNAYNFLEHNRVKEPVDLGLRNPDETLE